MAIMKDVAKLAGVSITTVSFVMNGTAKEHKVADKTVNKVLRAAKQLGYKVNSSGAEELLQQMPVTIAFFTPIDSAQLDMNVVYAGINQHIKQTRSNYSVLLCPYEKGELLEKIRQMDVNAYDAAVVCVDSQADADSLEEMDAYMPFVLYNASSNRFASVSCQIEEAISQVARMMAAKKYTRIVLLAGSDTPHSGNEYLNLFVGTCGEHGIAIEPEAFITTDNTVMGGAIAAHQILRLEQRPEMIVCMNSALAYGAIPVLARNDFYIPKHAELLCFGSVSEADHIANYIPALSMIALPSHEISRRAFDIALHLTQDRDAKPMHLTCSSTLILNRSFSV